MIELESARTRAAVREVECREPLDCVLMLDLPQPVSRELEAALIDRKRRAPGRRLMLVWMPLFARHDARMLQTSRNAIASADVVVLVHDAERAGDAQERVSAERHFCRALNRLHLPAHWAEDRHRALEMALELRRPGDSMVVAGDPSLRELSVELERRIR